MAAVLNPSDKCREFGDQKTRRRGSNRHRDSDPDLSLKALPEGDSVNPRGCAVDDLEETKRGLYRSQPGRGSKSNASSHTAVLSEQQEQKRRGSGRTNEGDVPNGSSIAPPEKVKRCTSHGCAENVKKHENSRIKGKESLDVSKHEGEKSKRRGSEPSLSDPSGNEEMKQRGSSRTPEDRTKESSDSSAGKAKRQGSEFGAGRKMNRRGSGHTKEGVSLDASSHTQKVQRRGSGRTREGDEAASDGSRKANTTDRDTSHSSTDKSKQRGCAVGDGTIFITDGSGQTQEGTLPTALSSHAGKSKRRGSGRMRQDDEAELDDSGTVNAADRDSLQSSADKSKLRVSGAGNGKLVSTGGSGQIQEGTSLTASPFHTGKSKRRGSGRTRQDNETELGDSGTASTADRDSLQSSGEKSNLRPSAALTGTTVRRGGSGQIQEGTSLTASPAHTGKSKRRGSGRTRQDDEEPADASCVAKVKRRGSNRQGGDDKAGPKKDVPQVKRDDSSKAEEPWDFCGWDLPPGGREPDLMRSNMMESLLHFPEPIFASNQTHRTMENTSAAATAVSLSPRTSPQVTAHSKMLRRNSAPFATSGAPVNPGVLASYNSFVSGPPNFVDSMQLSKEIDLGEFDYSTDYGYFTEYDQQPQLQTKIKTSSQHRRSSNTAADGFDVLSVGVSSYGTRRFARRESEPFSRHINKSPPTLNKNNTNVSAAGFPIFPDRSSGLDSDDFGFIIADINEIPQGSEHRRNPHRPRRGSGRFREGATIVHRSASNQGGNNSCHQGSSSRLQEGATSMHRVTSNQGLNNSCHRGRSGRLQEGASSMHRVASNQGLGQSYHRSNSNGSRHQSNSNQNLQSRSLRDHRTTGIRQSSDRSLLSSSSNIDGRVASMSDIDDAELLNRIEDMLSQEDIAELAHQETKRNQNSYSENQHFKKMHDEREHKKHGKQNRDRKEEKDHRSVATEKASIGKSCPLDPATEASMPRVASTKHLPSSGIAMAIVKHVH